MVIALGEKGDGKVTRWPATSIGSSIPWFRAQLEARGIVVPPFGPLHIALERSSVLREMAIAQEPFNFSRKDDAFEFFSQAIDADFVTKTLHRGVEAGLEIDDARWRHFVSDQPHVACAGDEGDGRHRLWETILASTVTTFATNVHFDEPDVVCQFRGQSFGIAAKFVHSDRRVWKNVRKGIRQATGRSAAALVVANVVDLLPLRDIYLGTLAKPPSDPIQVVDSLKDWSAAWCETSALKTLVSELRESQPQVFGVAFFMPFLINWHGVPTPFFYTHLPITWGGDESVDYLFAKAFLQASQAVTGFGAAAV